MAKDKKSLRMLEWLEEGLDEIKDQLAVRFDRDDPLQILPYRGFGTPDRLLFQGRVLQDEPVGGSAKEDSVWKNLGDTWKRFESDEVPGVPVRATAWGWTGDTVTDEEGYYRFDARLPRPVDGDGLWHDVNLEMRDPRTGQPVTATGQVLVPRDGASFGVISDIDDTVVQTGVTDRLAMARTVFLRNAHTRLPFEGVAAFYRALHQGSDGDDRNPVFFVSGSPWNLYDLLAKFMELHEIPPGPILLRDFGFDRRKLLHARTQDHKLECIRPVLDLYSDLPFLLIGDSGEQDPEIYREVVREYPGRVRAIYIRNVGGTAKREDEVAALAREVEAEGVAMLLVKDTEAASVHAHQQGWIRVEKLPEVREEKAKDQALPTPAEAVAAPGAG